MPREAKLTDSALGNVASEMAGQSVLQTNSPQNKVTAALNSANKSKAVSSSSRTAIKLTYSSLEGSTTRTDSPVLTISNWSMLLDCMSTALSL